MPNSVAVFAALDELVPPQALLALSKVIVAISDLVAFAQAQKLLGITEYPRWAYFAASAADQCNLP